MKINVTNRGFEVVVAPNHASEREEQMIIASSVIGNYPDAWDRPGSSALWFGSVLLYREEVRELVSHLEAWLATGSLKIGGEK